MAGNTPQGLVIVVSGPSGAGKSTVLRSLLAQSSNCVFSISATTRAPRPGEIDGVHYFFYDSSRFKEEVAAGEFLEWTEFCGNLYGTPRKHVMESVNSGFNVILDIETNGAMEVKTRIPEAVTIFILPPSLAELKRRIYGRGTESAEVVDARLKVAKKEIEVMEKYEYYILNDCVDSAVEQIKAIILAESLRIGRSDVFSILKGFELGTSGNLD